ncbi:N-acetylglutamate synthase-like GNAT family acetyltransferase [Myroides gitamensis]|uniref:GNAT family N-acetyltransferase n=1 Tax=Myroides odoratus TaxID=256 RepID=UPI002169835C|nr:GNAT family N-acetyltransferase [Myroides odoratus]MCS4238189.1 N-acetylglutamate synthase-like GNAT family acetyltransferase [Myroides odoratus]MDH6601011.1 N-acetylglutamate synthase-like GNAT family acetyltransferase [Myroides gitamensis]
MKIRTMEEKDAAVVADLLKQLGYPDTLDFLPAKIVNMRQESREKLLVVEEQDQVIGLISLSLIPQLALRGDFMRISYFAVDAETRSKGIGKQVEDYVAALARQMGCDRIELHCHSRRTQAHDFYLRQGYEEVPKYFVKYLK